MRLNILKPSFVRLSALITEKILKVKDFSQIIHLSRVHPFDSCTCLPHPSDVLCLSTQLLPGCRKPTPLCVTPAPTLGCPLLIRASTPSRSLRPTDRPSFETPVVHLPEVTPAMEVFSFSLRSASQQAASNCCIFSWQEETAHITSRDVAW